MIPIRQTMTILDRIAESKARRLEVRRRAMPAEELAELASQAAQAGTLPVVADFRQAVHRPGHFSIIAEIKKASPSRGIIQADFHPAAQARAYAGADIQAISILTEEDYFAGSDEDLLAARQAASLPILRKDFTLEPGQIYEARLFGASAILLIAALLDAGRLAGFLRLAVSLGLAAVAEVHDRAELAQALDAGASIIGINNRNLRTFAVDLATTEKLAGMIPTGITMIAESGISAAADITRVSQAGAHAALIGESLMRIPCESGAIRQKIRELRGGILI